MRLALSPTEQDRFREQPAYLLNFSQRHCKGECRKRRSTGQFTLHAEICDRCYKRMPKPA